MKIKYFRTDEDHDAHYYRAQKRTHIIVMITQAFVGAVCVLAFAQLFIGLD